MLRMFVCATVSLMLFAGIGMAGQKGQKKKAGKTVVGAIKKIDATAGTLTINVRSKKTTTEREFKIGDSTKFFLDQVEPNKELVGTLGLKNDQLKEGKVVTVAPDPSDPTKAKEVRLGGVLKKKKKDK